MTEEKSHDADASRTAYIRKAQASPTAGLPQELVHTLVVIEGQEPGRRVRIGSLPLTVGRFPPCGLVLPDTGVSRAHCEVRAQLDTALVKDLDSTNGTFVDGKRVVGTMRLFNGGMIQLGRHLLRYESLTPVEAESIEGAGRDFLAAVDYVHSLLPAPIDSGPVRVDRIFVPSTRLGGDVLGYHAIDDQRFAIYLVDVSAHGSAAAMHGASILNLIRHQGLPGVDFGKPDEILGKLNEIFQMEQHGGMFFTLWYGVYDQESRSLVYASAGRHPAFLVPAARDRTIALHTHNVAVGTLKDYRFKTSQVRVMPDSTLYLFSHGAFEIVTRVGQTWTLDDFLPLLLQPPVAGLTESQRIYEAVENVARAGPLEDDLSIVAVTFV